MSEDLRLIPLDPVARDEHVPRIERAISTLKERARCYCHGLSYTALPITISIALVELANHWLNQFPNRDGISQTLSPSATVLGIPNPDCNKLKICFGSYAQVFESTNNRMHRRNTPAIALLPSNQRGGHYFMKLYTGRRIHSYQWKELPIPDNVVKRVAHMAKIQKQPRTINGIPSFEW